MVLRLKTRESRSSPGLRSAAVFASSRYSPLSRSWVFHHEHLAPTPFGLIERDQTDRREVLLAAVFLYPRRRLQGEALRCAEIAGNRLIRRRPRATLAVSPSAAPASLGSELGLQLVSRAT